MIEHERSLREELTAVEAAIEVVESECPKDWLRYCYLAHQLEDSARFAISPKEAGGKHLSANGNSASQGASGHAGITRLYSRLGHVPPHPLDGFEVILEETRKLEQQFRDLLLTAVRIGCYAVFGFNGLNEVAIPTALVKRESFRFDADEMQVGGIELRGVHFVRNLEGSRADGPGRKPGQATPKKIAWGIALSILDDNAKRPPKGHGRLTRLARMVRDDLKHDQKTYHVNSIEKQIRGSFKQWQAANPDT